MLNWPKKVVKRKNIDYFAMLFVRIALGIRNPISQRVKWMLTTIVPIYLANKILSYRYTYSLLRRITTYS
jgi:hypothetical protein